MNPLVEAFERGEVESFHHRDHVKMAWSYLREFGFGEGARRFTEAIQRFATAHGKPNLYHATITWAYLVLINERMAGDDWETFARDNEDLFAWKPSIIDSWYRGETLASDRARRVFLFPDLLVRAAGALRR